MARCAYGIRGVLRRRENEITSADRASMGASAGCLSMGLQVANATRAYVLAVRNHARGASADATSFVGGLPLMR
jgi:hypothetical protein